MDKKNYFSPYSYDENAIGNSCTMGTCNKTTNNGESDLTRFETLILRCTRSNPKTETKISREIQINLPIVSQLITELMMKGLLERSKNRRPILFAKKEYFSTTIEGLIALENIQRNGTNFTFLSQVVKTLKDSGRRIVEEATPNSLTLKLVFGTLRLVYRVAKYVLTK
jgi:DNA-binding MarR family transcriptional regulator